MTTTVPPAAGPAAAIGKVTADISMSLDGFTTGPNDTPQKPLGEGGNRLHAWLEGLGDWGERPDLTGPHADVFRASHAHVGAAVMGRRVFNNGVAPWGDNPPFHVPVFVVTHQSESAPGQGGRNDLYLRHRGHRARPREQSRGQGCPARGRGEDRSPVHRRWTARRAADPPGPGAARRWHSVVRPHRSATPRAGMHGGGGGPWCHPSPIPHPQVRDLKARATSDRTAAPSPLGRDHALARAGSQCPP
jgi:hypothetical protein